MSRCIPCEHKQKVVDEKYLLRKQRAMEWGRKNNHVLVGLFQNDAEDDEDEEDPGDIHYTFAAEGDPILIGKKVEWLWCN